MNAAEVKERGNVRMRKVAVIIAAVVIAAGGVFMHSRSVAHAQSYDHAVACIVAGDYEEAAEALTDLKVQDSEALLSYVTLQKDLDEYKGEPDELLEEMDAIDGIENEEVQEQYEEAREEIRQAEEIQEEVDSLDIESVETIDGGKVSLIEKLQSRIKERYGNLVADEKYEIASKVLYNVENDTEAGRLLADIDNIGDVSAGSGNELRELRERYDDLSDEDKQTILNYDELTEAENKYSELTDV